MIQTRSSILVTILPAQLLAIKTFTFYDLFSKALRYLVHMGSIFAWFSSPCGNLFGCFEEDLGLRRLKLKSSTPGNTIFGV
jgi:hypothetical protein